MTRNKKRSARPPLTRSEIMARVRSRGTVPELTVRQLLRAQGKTGYRLYRNDLPGKPDIAFIGRKKAIFIHGCFWHCHDCKNGLRKPKTSQDYWLPKLERNRGRDKAALERLAAFGWDALVVWECETKDVRTLAERLSGFLERVQPDEALTSSSTR